MVGDRIEERIRFRCTAALRASTQIRFIVRAWRQQVNQLECAMRRVAFRRRALEEAHEGYVEALKQLEQCLGFNRQSAELPLLGGAHTRWSKLARAVVAAHRRASRGLIAVRRLSWYRIANSLVRREANDRGCLWSNVRSGSGTTTTHVKSGGTLTEYRWMMMRKSACQRTRQFACQCSVPSEA